MKRYIARRLLQIIPVLFIITFIVFALLFLTGDPVLLMLPDNATEVDRAALREALQLDRPFYVQYASFVWGMLHGNFGKSYYYGQEALPFVLERLPATFELAAASMGVAIVIGVPFGIWSATHKNKWLDVIISGVSVLGKAMPNFWFGIMLILLFSVNLHLLPVSGRGTLSHLVLPAVTLGFGVAAQITRLIRSAMLEILQQDYIRTARSKGLIETLVIYRHAFRNALIPVVTIIAMQASALIGGALITETVFSWPGLGQLLVQALSRKDMAIVEAAVCVITLVVIISNLLADIVYKWLDPRIKYQ
ncbi:ABC transporter permease [Paenibacillus thalictri]|uniref:ABC transporter permease n=1 Tax=Paenibacillus thalictri TaxID=2527873 RepID=A0A4Q9DUN6_9BACL|nr:ABC transporter permease [Paenibacillus thalictri]TBL80724.1 ABC transporter permease [Paenibacillus thalictri]